MDVDGPAVLASVVIRAWDVGRPGVSRETEANSVASAPKSVLVVDESIVTREIVSFLLGTKGYRVIGAEDAEEALEIAARHCVDLVIVEYHLPTMDGLRFLHALRSLHGYAEVPALIVAADTAPALKAEARTAGAKAWLMKPFDTEALVEIVERIEH
jgi:two-component system chemotaxis response regulator CheY